MSRRHTNSQLPAAPAHWDASSRAAWAALIQSLESASGFASGRRSPERFVVKTTVSAVTTLDLATPEVTALAHIVARLLIALKDTDNLDIREV